LIGPYFGDLIKGTGKLFPDILRFIINMVSSIDEHLHELSVPVTNEIQQVKNYKSLLKDLYQHCMIPLTLLLEYTSSSFHRSEDLTLFWLRLPLLCQLVYVN
uniref:Uncharacterized protein n=1 Tax=Amphimedon queenslandica TaxID=400682 RepID=A0A1X7T8H2_AMPQE